MNKISKLLLTAGLTAGTILATPGCSGDSDSSPNGPVPRTFLMGYKPIQCEQTPWEADSLSLVDYYTAKGVEVYDTSRTRVRPSCTACGCPSGYTLIAEVAAKDTLALMNDGFFHFNPKRN